jgi:CheY-like chemotaxis protein
MSSAITSASGQRVLVADDDDDTRELLCASLIRSGFEVVEFHDGASLVDWAQRSPHGFQAVVSDIGMPGLDGVQVCERLRAIAPLVPVILVTAYRDQPTLGRARQAGAREILSKPTTPRQVISLVKQVLGQPPTG